MVYLRWCDSASFKIILLSQLRCRLWQATYKAAYLPSHQAPVMPMPVQVQWDGPAKLADAGSAVVPFGLLRGSPKFPPRWLELCLNMLNHLAGFTLSAHWFQSWWSDLSGRSSSPAALAQTEKRWTLSEFVSPVFLKKKGLAWNFIYTTNLM